MPVGKIGPVMNGDVLERGDIQLSSFFIRLDQFRVVLGEVLNLPKMRIQSTALGSRKRRKNLEHLHVDQKSELHGRAH
jgi:hypothetical protein